MATECQKLGCISLWTVPILMENRSKSLIINALLDDGSTQTYLNADIAAKLALHGEIWKSKVNVINGTVATFETALVEFTLRSMNGQVNTVIEAFVVNVVTGDLIGKLLIGTGTSSEVLIPRRLAAEVKLIC